MRRACHPAMDAFRRVRRVTPTMREAGVNRDKSVLEEEPPKAMQAADTAEGSKGDRRQPRVSVSPRQASNERRRDPSGSTMEARTRAARTPPETAASSRWRTQPLSLRDTPPT